MRSLAVLLALALLAVPARGQGVTVPHEVCGVRGAWVIIPVTKVDGDAPRWELPPGLTEVDLSLLFPNLDKDQARAKVVTAQKDGTYEVRVWNAKVIGKKAVPSGIARVKVVVGTPDPEPDPDPDPKPDPPKPDPKAIAVPRPGLHVLMVYESGDQGKLTAGQRSVLYGRKIRDWLDRNAAQEPDGKTRAWRIFDREIDASADAKPWSEWLARPRPSVPAWVVSNGKASVEGPLPATDDEAIAILGKLKGN